METLDPKLDGASLDSIQENLAKLKDDFPEVFIDGKIDLDAFKELFGEYIESKEERYNFMWHGKSQAKQLAQTPSTGTLRPCPEESVNWDTTQNLFIEGDNLEVLKLLQKSYHNKIKMIYIDPPYNTGNDFIYRDNFRDNLKNYLELTEQVGKEGKRWSSHAETSGRYHTDWLNMMYPRLKLARNLLKDDGLIFISIDDNEVDNLKKICDELFGDENFVGRFAWRKKIGAGADSKHFFRQHEYILLYAKNLHLIHELFQPLTEQQKKEYSNPDNDPRGSWAPTDLSGPAHDNDPRRIYEVVSPTGIKHKKCWAYTKENFQKLIEDNLIWWGKDGTTMPKRKRFLSEKKGLTPRSWIDSLLTSDGKNDLKEIHFHTFFDYPKPKKLIYLFLQIATEKDDIVLDFFAGSCTAAHAVMDLNKEDNGARTFIMIQLPESCNVKSQAYKEGFQTIADIGKERIRRVGKKINETNPEELDSRSNKVDTGFRVFKLDTSNIVPWDVEFDAVEEGLLASMDTIKTDRSEADILYEILLKYGLELTIPIEKRCIAGKKVYIIGMGVLIICLDKEIPIETVEGIGKLKEEFNPEVIRVVFKDTGFNDDIVKTSTIQVLKRYDIIDVKSI